MGLTETSLSARSSSARRNLYACEALSDSVLLAAGRRPAEPSGGSLADGSFLRVGEDQCAMLVSGGRVADFCAVPGTYAFDSRKAAVPRPGPLKDQVLESWRQLSPAPGGPKPQRLYFANLQAVPGPDFESTVPFRLVSPAHRLDADVSLTCVGRFAYRVCDPVLFYTNVTGSVEDRFDNGELNESLRREAVLQLRPVLARLAEEGRPFSGRAAFCQAIAEGMKKELALFWPDLRGIAPETVTVSAVCAQGGEGELFDRWLAAGVSEASAYKDPREWFCPDCGAASTGNFCPQCGREKPGPWYGLI